MATTFKPAIDIKAILASVKPEAPTKRESKAKKADGTPKSNVHRSLLSGFPTMHGTMEFLLAINPDIAYNQATAVLDQEFPYGFQKKGVLVATEAEGKRCRLNADGTIMVSGGKPVSRAFCKSHFSYYKKDILGNKNWTLSDDFGITHEMKAAAEAAYAAANVTEEDETETAE